MRTLLPWVFLAIGCSVPTVAPSDDPGAQGIVGLLSREYGASVHEMPRTVEEFNSLRDLDCLILLSETDGESGQAVPAEVLSALRLYVRGGGSLLLLGYTTRLVHEIGFEPIRPDRCTELRWGADDRTASGLMHFGFRAKGVGIGLDQGLRAAANRDQSFLIGGGSLVTAQACYWQESPPQSAEILGRLTGDRDGETIEHDGVVLARWLEGDGEVVACGFVPEPWRTEEDIRANAIAFVNNLITALGGSADSKIAVCVSRKARRTAVSETKGGERLGDRAVPGEVAIPHWGWQIATNYQHAHKGCVAPSDIFTFVMQPSHYAGASLMDLRLPDAHRGYSFDWKSSDVLRSPPGWFGGAFWQEWWPAEQVRALARHAHAHGMLMQTWLNPAPIRRGGIDSHYVASIKWLSRELGDVRLFSDATLDGLGFHDWFDDSKGYTMRQARVYQPGVYGYSTSPRNGRIDHAIQVVDAALGRPAGINAAGVSEGWRDVFSPAVYAGAMLDCHVKRPSRKLWRGKDALGGGSYPDWILKQANDYARSRFGTGAAMWWQAYNVSTMNADTVDYVHGVSMDPLRAAVATRLSATGKDGYRDRVAQQYEATKRMQVQAGFAPPLDALRARTAFLQNNHFRLYGSGGPLVFDASGSADHDEPTAPEQRLAGAFLATEVRGFIPRAQPAEGRSFDFIGTASRASGGYGDVGVAIAGLDKVDHQFPAMLGVGEAPTWPEWVAVGFEVPLGSYDLELELLGQSENGLLEVRLDGELLALLPYQSGAKTQAHAVPIQLAKGGRRSLKLIAIDGGTVMVPRCTLRRRGDSSNRGETQVLDKAGVRASLVEHVRSPYFAARVELSTVADMPGFLLVLDYLSAARRVEVVQRFGLTGYRRVRRSLGGELSTQLTRPFVLGSDDPKAPDIAVIPLMLPKYHSFKIGDEGWLEMLAYPRPHQRVAIAFVFLRDHVASDLEALVRVCQAALQPEEVRVATGKEITLETDLPIPWVRALRIAGGPKQAFMVEEGGQWLFRGSQPAHGGGRWLKVYHLPGHPVRILGFDDPKMPVRPGPGSLHAISLSEVKKESVSVNVLSAGPLLAAPSIEVREKFDVVTLDGQPWQFFSGNKIYLPCRPGRHQVSWHELRRESEPRLARTRAIVTRCRYDSGARRVLEFHTRARPEDPPGTEYTAWLEGPVPVDLIGAVRVEEEFQSYPTAQHAEAAVSKGVIIRFKPGLVQARYH